MLEICILHQYLILIALCDSHSYTAHAHTCAILDTHTHIHPTENILLEFTMKNCLKTKVNVRYSINVINTRAMSLIHILYVCYYRPSTNLFCKENKSKANPHNSIVIFDKFGIISFLSVNARFSIDVVPTKLRMERELKN